MTICNSFQGALDAAFSDPKIKRVFAIGGQQIYKEALSHPSCEAIYMTAIHRVYPCSVFFPKIDPGSFEILERTCKTQPGESDLSYDELVLVKIRSEDVKLEKHIIASTKCKFFAKTVAVDPACSFSGNELGKETSWGNPVKCVDYDAIRLNYASKGITVSFYYDASPVGFVSIDYRGSDNAHQDNPSINKAIQSASNFFEG